VRKALGVILIVTFSLLAVGTAGAQNGHGRKALPKPEVALQQALAVFRPHLADPSYRLHEKVDPRGATALLRNLAASVRQLSPADRRLAEAILARPTDNGNGNYTAPKSDFRHKCFTNFCVHWVRSTRDAPSLADRNPKNHIPDWIDKVRSVMSFVWNKEVVDFGYGPPRGDGNSGSHRSGNPNPKIDIFIQDVGRQGLYGYCTSDDPKIRTQNNISAYCVFDDDFSKKQFGGAATGLAALKVTAAHEFNHAIQFNYDAFEDLWFLEATATNTEADVYPAIHDNYQYFPASPLSKTMPLKPIDRWEDNGLNQYGSWIFFRFLAEFFTDPSHPIATAPDPAFVHEIWHDAKATPGTIDGGEYSTEAIESFLGAHGETFPSVFRQFGVANTAPATWYKDGGAFKTRAGQAYTINTIDSGPGGSADLKMTHMSNDYWFFTPGTGASTLDIEADFPAAATSPRATVLSFDTGGALVDEQEVSLDPSGVGSVAGLTFDSTVSKVVVVVTNASTRFTQCNTDFDNPPFFSCFGKPRDDSTSKNYQLDLSAP
jgi:mannose-6-phosphate isomerase-like protein (cupin superfamily)